MSSQTDTQPIIAAPAAIAAPGAYQVLLFYKYVSVDEPHELAQKMRSLALELSLFGRIIVAAEGINATLEGTVKDTEAFVGRFLADARFIDTQIKRSVGSGKSFTNLSVRVRDEIVSTGLTQSQADPRISTAPKLSAEDLRDWYESKRDFVVVDMRNNYEFASGHFKDSVEPGISASRHLPLVLDKLEPLKEKTIVTVCTGGVRCEKMSAYLMHEGFKDVHQLDGGIHTYMQKFPGKDFLGTLYTFDQRLTMDFDGVSSGGGVEKVEREVIGRCYLCNTLSERYANCAEPTCHLHLIACDACTDADGRVFCSPECKKALMGVRVQRNGEKSDKSGSNMSVRLI
jgi:UPF0176 protein